MRIFSASELQQALSHAQVPWLMMPCVHKSDVDVVAKLKRFTFTCSPLIQDVLSLSNFVSFLCTRRSGEVDEH